MRNTKKFIMGLICTLCISSINAFAINSSTIKAYDPAYSHSSVYFWSVLTFYNSHFITRDQVDVSAHLAGTDKEAYGQYFTMKVKDEDGDLVCSKKVGRNTLNIHPMTYKGYYGDYVSYTVSISGRAGSVKTGTIKD